MCVCVCAGSERVALWGIAGSRRRKLIYFVLYGFIAASGR